MESLVLNLQSKKQIADYVADNHLVRYEKDIFQETISTIEAGDRLKLDGIIVLAIPCRPLL